MQESPPHQRDRRPAPQVQAERPLELGQVRTSLLQGILERSDRIVIPSLPRRQIHLGIAREEEIGEVPLPAGVPVCGLVPQPQHGIVEGKAIVDMQAEKRQALLDGVHLHQLSGRQVQVPQIDKWRATRMRHLRQANHRLFGTIQFTLFPVETGKVRDDNRMEWVELSGSLHQRLPLLLDTLGGERN